MFKPQSGKRAIAIAIGAVLALSMGACSSSPATDDSAEAGPVELRMAWWGGDGRHALTNEVLDLFEEQNEGITVVRDFGGFDGYLDKITTQYTGSNSPDVFQFYNEVLVEFASRGQLYDLNQAVEAGDLSLDGWPEDIIEMNTVDGELSALTFGLSTQGFIFDETISSELGVELPAEGYTWDDFAAYGAAIRAASDGATAGTTDLSHSYQVFEVFAKQRGEEFLDAKGIGFSEKTLADFWTYWESMRASGAATSPDISTEYLGTPYDAVIAGVAASTFLFVNQYESVTNNTTNPITVMRMPSEAKNPGQYLRPAMNLVISQQTKHPKESAMLLDFLLNNAEANEILGIDRGVPSNGNVVSAATSGASDVAQKAIAVIESVREGGSPAPAPAPSGSAAVNTLFSEIAQQLQFGSITPGEAAAMFMEQAASELG